MKKIGLLFFGLFLYYTAICLYSIKAPLKNDEGRYYSFAINLTNGYYAPEKTLNLWNGPGYPLVLYPFVKAGLPYWAGRCLNPVFLVVGVIFLYELMRFYVSDAKALIGSAIFGLYPPLLPDMVKLLTEPFAVFLICGLCYFTARCFLKKTGGNLLAAGLFGGMLILTKLMFAYVITAELICVLIWAAIGYKAMWRMTGICILSLFFCMPYLYYTWSLTGRPFYWGNAGGSMLYWNTDPCSDHWGDWHYPPNVLSDPRYAAHQQLFKQLQTMDYVQQDAILKREAIANIKAHPVKFAYNLIANTGRLWLDYPYTYKQQRPHTLFYMIPNAILLGGLCMCIYPWFKAFRKIRCEMHALTLLILIYLMLSVILSAVARYLVPAAAWFIVIMTYTAFVLLDIRFRTTDELSSY